LLLQGLTLSNLDPVFRSAFSFAFLVLGCSGGTGTLDLCNGGPCSPCLDGCGDASETAAGADSTAAEATEAGASSAVVLPDGRLAIASYDELRSSLVVIFQRPGAADRIVRVVSSGAPQDAGRWARIALETSGALQIIWFDSAFGAVRWSRGNDLAFETPDTVSTGAASHLALAVDGSDRPHVAFRDENARAVRYTTRQGGRWNLTNIVGCAGEDNCPVAGAEDFGQAIDLAFVQGAGGVTLPRVAFYDARRGDLKLAGLDAEGRWTTVTLDGRGNGVDTGDVGRFVSLAATPTRSLGVAYFDATLGALRYIGPAGSPRVIDNGLVLQPEGRARRSIVGQFCQLQYGPQGSAHILYVDASMPGLRHARVAGEGPAALTELAIPPGTWPSFEVVGDRLVGAYGAFVPGEVPRTTLRLFDLSAAGLRDTP